MDTGLAIALLAISPGGHYGAGDQRNRPACRPGELVARMPKKPCGGELLS
jgi:hypothetical protein